MKITIERIIKNYFRIVKSKGMIRFPIYLVETELPQWGEKTYNILHTPGTYARIFRRLVEKQEIVVEQIEVEKQGKVKWYKLIEIK